jgi:hypothetical protein
MATTTNFGWTTPDDTALVKDGASAIRSLGSAIDASMAELKGGTTGQVLSKNSNTDMDFTWVAQDDSNAIQNAIVDAKGDLITATAADTPARLAVGTNGQYLSANSSTATGLEWVTAATGAWSQVASGSLSGSSTSITGLSGKNLIVRLSSMSHNDASARVYRMTVNSDTGTNYIWNSTTGTGNNNTYINLSDSVTNSSSSFINLYIFGADSTTLPIKPIIPIGQSSTAFAIGGAWVSTSAITSLQIIVSAGSFDAGTYQIWKQD